MRDTFGWGLLGAATTILARRIARRAMHEPGGEPRLPDAAHRSSLSMVLLLAAAAGTALALADVLQEQRKHVTQLA
jgi:hypothetical protein